MQSPSLRLIILAAIVVVTILVAVLVFLATPHKPSSRSQYNLVRFGELFRHATNLNLGHPEEAPLFQARPWFGTHGSNFVGVCTIPSASMLRVNFAAASFGYEVNVLLYPEWEPLTEPLYKPTTLTLGHTKESHILLPSLQSQVLLLVTGITGFSAKREVTAWLDRSETYFTPVREGNALSVKQLPKLSDREYATVIANLFDTYFGQWQQTTPNYELSSKVMATRQEASFPATKGILWSIVYTPSVIGEVLFIVAPNRARNLGLATALSLETRGGRSYLQQADAELSAGIYCYSVTSEDTIYLEERLLVDSSSDLLPFYLYVASPEA